MGWFHHTSRSMIARRAIHWLPSAHSSAVHYCRWCFNWANKTVRRSEVWSVSCLMPSNAGKWADLFGSIIYIGPYSCSETWPHLGNSLLEFPEMNMKSQQCIGILRLIKCNLFKCYSHILAWFCQFIWYALCNKSWLVCDSCYDVTQTMLIVMKRCLPLTWGVLRDQY